MDKPGIEVVSIDDGALPFVPRLLISAKTATRDINVEFDPRLVFTPAARDLVARDMGSRPIPITEHDLIAYAGDVCRHLNSYYARGVIHLAEKKPPLWEHDCVDCVYLGGYADNDLYYCHAVDGKATRFPTLVARWGSHGPQYTSGSPFIPHSRCIWAAAVLAEDQKITPRPFIKTQHVIVIDDKCVTQTYFTGVEY